MLVYTVPMAMQPSSGDTSSSAQTPQKENSRAMEMISLLSVERLLGISSFMKRPKVPPRAMITAFRATGFTRAPKVKPLPFREASATEIATE